MAEMQSAEVPKAPHEIFLAYTDAEAHCWGRPEHGIRYAACCRQAGLAAALKLHEQQLRERIAAELRAVMFRCPTHTGRLMPDYDPRCIGCHRYAALVDAVNIIEGRESFGAKAVREARAAASAVADGSEEVVNRG